MMVLPVTSNTLVAASDSYFDRMSSWGLSSPFFGSRLSG